MARSGKGTRETGDAWKGKSGRGRSSNSAWASDTTRNVALRAAEAGGTSREDEEEKNQGRGDGSRRREATRAIVGCEGRQVAWQDGHADASSEGYEGVEEGDSDVEGDETRDQEYDLVEYRIRFY